MALPKERVTLKKSQKRRKSQRLLRILSIRTQWTSKKRESSNLSGKNIDTVTGEKDLARLSLLLRQRFQ